MRMAGEEEAAKGVRRELGIWCEHGQSGRVGCKEEGDYAELRQGEEKSAEAALICIRYG
jgi:hypothetical protein